MHLVPVYIANVMMTPVPPPAPYVSVINLADFLFDDQDDDELGGRCRAFRASS